MTAITLHHFDTLEYVKKSKKMGVSEELAEYQARQIEQSIEIAVNTIQTRIEEKELSAENDSLLIKKEIHESGVRLEGKIRETELKLQKEIETVRKEIETVRKEIALANSKTIVWIAGLLVASGFIQHFFH